MSGVKLFTVSLTVMALAAPAAAAAGPPRAVSPGAANRFTAVSTPCPTFSWTAVDGATGYELVVYELSEEGADDDASEPSRGVGEAPALRVHIPGRALSWTPSAEDCLGISGSYAWSVRALGEGAPGGWSAGSLFRVEPGPMLEAIGAVLERALSRYLEDRGLRLEPDGELAALLAQEIAGSKDPAAGPPPPAVPGGEIRYSHGRRLGPGEPVPRGAFLEDVELTLRETGSGAGDKVQLVFVTPEFDNDPVFRDAWAIVVDAEDSADPDDGMMFFSTPSFADALQLFTDGSAIVGPQREMTLRRLSSPPFPCTSLQEGAFYWDEELGELCDCNGSGWAPVDGTGTCS